MVVWGKYLSVVLASTIKFIGGPITGFALGLPWLLTAALTVAGMMLAVLSVAVLGGHLQRWWAKRRQTQAHPRRFSKRSRLAVRVWQRFGIWGIACLTPVLFTPIGGTVIALSFRVPLAKLLVAMLVFGILWGLIFTLLLYQLEGVRTFFV